IPDGWVSQVISGNHGWSFGMVDNDNAGSNNTINGSCMAFFDDDVLGQDAPFSSAILLSPVINGLDFAAYQLAFDAVIRQYNDLEQLSVGIRDELTGEITWAQAYLEDQGGPLFDASVSLQVDLTDYRTSQMRLAFLYDDGNGWGWWTAIDNIKLIGSGSINDLCENAVPLALDGPCITGTNQGSVYTGPNACTPPGVGSLWYQYTAQESHWAHVQSGAAYNDAIAIFTGDCSELNILECTDYDAHGFIGEDLFFEATAGSTYFIRVHGQRAEFGLSHGEHCIQLTNDGAPPAPPANDLCAGAIPLMLEEGCTPGTNRFASFDGPVPSRNNKSQADIWYQFTPESSLPLLIQSQADFADVLTLYRGICGELEEVACNELGQELRFETPDAGTTYFLQVSGFFATNEGSCCVKIEEVPQEEPVNDICAHALLIDLGTDCISTNPNGAVFSDPLSSCALAQSAAVWYAFTAPESGAIAFEIESEFVATLSVFNGNCTNLEELYCTTAPDACRQNNLLNGLTPGQLYYLRLGVNTSLTGWSTGGSACLRLDEIESLTEEEPLSLFANLECYGNGRALLQFEASGGSGSYTFSGNSNGSLLEDGAAYFAEVTDEAGCTAFISGTVACPAVCPMDATIEILEENDCPNDLNAILQVVTTGGSDSLQFTWQNGYNGAVLTQAMNGDYRVTVTDLANSCTAIAAFEIGIIAPIEVEVLALNDPTPDNMDGSIVVEVSGGTPPYLYDWELNGAFVSDDPNPQHLGPGTYTLTITDANGCTFIYTGIELNSPTSTTVYKVEGDVQVYPNPNRGLFYVDTEELPFPVTHMEVYAASGQLVRRIAVGTNWQSPYAIDLTGSSTGMYLLRVFTEAGIVQRR
ncbi:MAG: T9SS type A sorting domain-containing protein, partial [Mameliella sp.]|nr:T9SS type A sorting domain-containing protein [Phaeodactylibacter sp.]